jgi:hypothetical protein
MMLTALRPENPIAWMAACGALRLLPGARLRWLDGTPELDWDGDVVAALAALPAQRLGSPELQYAHKLTAKMDELAWQELKHLPGEWTLALGCQTETGMRCTNLKMRPGGGYDMMRDSRVILNRLCASDVTDKLTEALVGPWRYEDDDCVAWGWDAAARIDAAGIGSKAESAPKWGVLGAYWLGWEALPLFPMLDGKTRGWSAGLTYPTWSTSLDYQAVKALMLGVDGLRPAERKALGVRIWFADYLRTDPSSGRLGWAGEFARTRSDDRRQGGSRETQGPVTALIV